jgi:hypothetical protein
MKTCSPLILALALCLNATARDNWPDALRAMPLNPAARWLNHTNCTQVILPSFQSNAAVKAVIFLPGATDELYFFRRVSVAVTNSNPTLLDAIIALTNGSPLRVLQKESFLLIHSAEDVLDLKVEIKHPATVAKLKTGKPLPRLEFHDRDWDRLLSVIQPKLPVTLEPWSGTRDSWHFYRHTFAGWNLTPWETLEAAAYAGKTEFVVRRRTVSFSLDPRFGKLPVLEQFPPKR